MSKLLKDEICFECINKLAVCIDAQHSEFNSSMFVTRCMTANWPELSLKQRIRQVSQSLHESWCLPYKDAIEVLQLVSTEFSGLFHFVFADYVELYGIEDFETSMHALALFTQSSTSEFGIRPFLQKKPEKTKQQMLIWSKSDNHHLRRLASEGIRPRLPWARHLSWIEEEPQWVLPILENLKNDESRYVQKSVANLLNDLSKTQPEWVLALCQNWLINPSQATYWIVKHGLRTLLKQGDVRALALIGYASSDHIRVKSWHLADKVNLGDKLHGEFELVAEQALGKVRIEYALSFLRKQHTPYRKVFKISESDYPMKTKAFYLTHNFKIISTRNYLPGLHKIELIVNGQILKTDQFELQN
ncbi:DNA alkylation repair protein [Thiomicrorhabdus sp. Kp2]|uniref:DNA alkylation repair protein n=1 Tax=Thiomicrorhabdus sp. Kp2 TaxID=1123518 RepID=UPI000592EFDE|nr:DNA alkylation repair protein [Thiomicrorhabdus sp. Kp2]